MNGHLKIAIIMLNWNGFDDTVECLKSLRRMDYGDFKVVLVDNASSDNEGARLKAMFHEVHLISNATNRGFAGGSNDGIAWAAANGFAYVVSLNNDCIVEKEWLTKLLGGLLSAGAHFGTSRVMNYPDKDIICSDGDVLLPDGSGVAENRGRCYAGGGSVRPVFCVSGAASVYSVDCLEKVKLKNGQYFDEIYFAYFEDVDLSIRLNAKGFKGVAVEDAVVYHKHMRATGKYSALRIFLTERNRILNMLLNYPFYFLPVGGLFNIVKVCRRLILALSSGKSKERAYFERVGPLRMAIIFFKANVWILMNIGTILSNRNERKKKGMIQGKLYRNFSWNLFRLPL